MGDLKLAHALMEPNPDSQTSPVCTGPAIGYASNEGAQRYLIEAESTTGFIAWKLSDGTTLVGNSLETSIAKSHSLSFWSCAGYEDATPAGQLTTFDCHANALTHLDVSALTGLKYLDCCFNQLTELDVASLTELEGLDADDNHLAALDVRNLKALRILNCASNQLTKLDLSSLAALQVLDCSKNPLAAPNLDGCLALKDCKGVSNTVTDTKTTRL